MRRSNRLRPALRWLSSLWTAALAATLLGVAGLAAPAAAEEGGAVRTGHVEAQLVAETRSAEPGSTLHVALRQRIAPGWHTYWRNPGDAGQPTTLDWTLPAGWRAGPIVWPAPGRDLAGPIMAYVYSGQVLLPVPLSVPAGAASGPAALKVHASWLVCKDVCIPESADLSLSVPVAPGRPAIDSSDGQAVADTLAAAPRPDGVQARFALDGDTLRLTATGAALKGLTPQGAYFYPYDGTVLDQASPQTTAADGADGVVLILPAGYEATHGKPPTRLEGVLAIDGRTFAIDARPGAAAGAAETASSPAAVAAATAPAPMAMRSAPAPLAASVAQARPVASTPPAGPGFGLLGAVGLAVLGGLVLNLMPCVFPILSMKAAALARHLEAPERARGEGLAFLGGVVGSFLLLAVLLIVARGAGQAVGWGFQLQSPAVVAVLALVMLAAGLNLSGVFEVGYSLQGIGADAAARRGGLAGAALTGALAVVTAAPCTAPFMAPAIGWALAQPPLAALLVFLGLGLGLAAPFTALSFAPALFGRLPRPGAWMETLRRVLAFPMYGAAAWLAWVFALQAGAMALPGLFGAALAGAFAAFAWGLAQRRGGAAALPRLAAGAALAAMAAGLVVSSQAAAGATGAAPPLAATAGDGGAPGSAEAWSPERVQALRAQGRPVFVDFTAAWCVTCQVNERTALAGREVADAFRRTGAAYLKADWTRPDGRITRALAAAGRSGVPLYLVYPASSGPPRVLPQLLTGGAVVQALDAARS